jgi:hypothetical protein
MWSGAITQRGFRAVLFPATTVGVVWKRDEATVITE